MTLPWPRVSVGPPPPPHLHAFLVEALLAAYTDLLNALHRLDGLGHDLK